MIDKNKIYSIFNDILGPIMLGPSSSHTAAPVRIGNLAGQLIENKPKKILIEFESNKSFAENYIGLKSDKGFIAGILGRTTDDPMIPLSLTEAKKRNIEVNFKVNNFKNEDYFVQKHSTIKKHSEKLKEEVIKINLTSLDNEKYIVLGKSIGGGIVEIVEINGLPISITGNHYEQILLLNNVNEKDMVKICIKIKKLIPDCQFIDHSTCREIGIINIKTNFEVNPDVLSNFKKIKKVAKVFQIKPILPVLFNGNCKVPFRTANDMYLFSKNKGIELWEAVLTYESIISGWKPKKILNNLKTLLAIMKEAIQNGLNREEELGYKSTEAKKIYNKYTQGKFLSTGILDKATIYALATMEVNSTSSGSIIAAPTAGACGILPSVILSIGEKNEISEDKLEKALLIAAGIGLAIAEQASFAGDVAGCQAECGSASSMAAGAAAYLADGNTEQILSAASIALQNMLGLICDPVCGQVIIPCINRNVIAVSNSICSANISISGYNPLIPLDEVIQAMYRVGKLLPPELKGTCMEGLRGTATAKKLNTQ